MIHPSAIIETGAQLGTEVQVGPFAYIGATAHIGDGCVLGPHAVVMDHTTLGARCTVHSGAVIGDLPQDLSFTGDLSYVVIGDDCTFREGVTVHRGAKADTATRIGNHVYMMFNSHAAHNVVIGDHCILASAALLAGYVTMGEGCFCGGLAGVHQFCRVGRYAIVGGAQTLTKDLPPFCMAATNGLNDVAGLNTIGLRRAGFKPDQRKQIQHAFNLVYRSGLNTSQAVERLKEESDNPFAAEFVEFIQHSKRGICRLAFKKRGK